MTPVWHLSQTKRKRVLKTLLGAIGVSFRAIDFLWPKKADVIVFGSLQGSSMAGSPKYLHEYIQKNRPDLRGFYYLPFSEEGVTRQLAYMLRFARTFFQARYLVSSHAPYDFIPFSWSKRKVLINAWHGTPLKCMFFSDPGASAYDLRVVGASNRLTSIFLVSSSIEAGLITRCFHLDPRKIAFTGHPRNDLLTADDPPRRLEGLFPSLPEYSKVLLYCPTYRREAPARFFPFEDLDLRHLDHLLEEHKIIILTRGHVNDHGEDGAIRSGRIIELDQARLPEVNDILPEVDVLITDYSSIYIDYLLLNRPCIFVPYDRETYEERVGFLFDDYDLWTPGRKIATYREFVNAVEDAITGDDGYRESRERLRELFHYYQDGNASEHVVRYIRPGPPGRD